MKIQPMSEEKLKHFVANGDVEYMLTPVVDSMLTHGLTHAQLLASVTESTKRVIRLSLSEQGVRLTVSELDAQAGRAATKLIERLTVKNPDAVPPVAKRNGLPAAIAAA
jgi:hypothetical protein